MRKSAKSDCTPSKIGVGNASTVDPAGFTQKGHSNSDFLWRIVAATLRMGGSQNKNNGPQDAETHHSHHPCPKKLGQENQKINIMDSESSQDSQEVKIISSEPLDYWEHFDSEVRMNGGNTPTR